MSCISEILKLKGDRDVLLPLREDGKPWIAVEGGGTYKDYEYLIVLNHNGHRCGYVAIPPLHPANEIGTRNNSYTDKDELDYMELNISCHGGLTFGSNSHGLKKLLTNECQDYWIGFDCGHVNDACDTEAYKKYYGEEKFKKQETFFNCYNDGSIKTFKYAENECKSIIDQLLEMKNE